jgi:hypothetical protein
MLLRRILELLVIVCVAAGLVAFAVTVGWLDQARVPYRSILLADRTGLTFWVIALGFWILRTAESHFRTLHRRL